MDWTDAHQQILLANWGKLSASQIAEMIGPDITRSAVCGMAHRRGLSVSRDSTSFQWTEEASAIMLRMYRDGASLRSIGGALKTTPSTVQHRVAKLGLRRSRLPPRARQHRPAQRLAPPVPQIDDGLIPLDQRKTLMELTDDTCRWPVGDVGDPGFFFCGAQTDYDCAYCPSHKARAYEAARPSRPYIPKRNAA